MFSKIAIGIKTFLRDEKLFTAIAGIESKLYDAKMIIADCGDISNRKEELYASLIQRCHTVIYLPFDAGFGAMSNAIVDALDRPYLLIGSDDFDFRPESVRIGIDKLQEVLDLTDIDIASGRVRGPYEFDLEDRGDTIIEHRVETNIDPVPWVIGCDLTVNYSLIRREVFSKVRWDDDIKIGGGEHGAFFVDVKRAGFKVGYVPGVEISEQEGDDSLEYKSYRIRSLFTDRPCFDRRGIKKYVLGSGKVDYDVR